MSTPDHPVESSLLDFAIAWAAFGGGGDKSIYVTFGLRPTTFFHRLRHVLDCAHRHDHLTALELIQTGAVCRRRLAQAAQADT